MCTLSSHKSLSVKTHMIGFAVIQCLVMVPFLAEAAAGDDTSRQAIFFGIASRCILAFVWLTAVALPWKPRRRERPRDLWIGLALGAISLVVWAVGFHREWIPEAYLDGSGLTAVIIAGEIMIWLMNAAILLRLLPKDRPQAAHASSPQTEPEGDRNRVMGKVLEKLFAHASEGMIVTDREQRILYVNAAFRQLSGYEEHEAVGQTPRLLRSGWHQPEFYRSMWRQISEEGSYRGEVWNKHKNGDMFLTDLQIFPICGDTGELLHYVGMMKDITAEKQLEAKVSYHTYHDDVTDLPNWTLLKKRFELAKGYAHHHQRSICVILLDLDQFKKINDAWGYGAGDLLLKETAQRLASTVRSSDTVARYNGDTFIVLLPDLRNRDDYRIVAGHLNDAFARPFVVDGQDIHIASSMGICLYPEHGDSLDSLIRHAETALHHAKRAGARAIQVYEAELEQEARGMG